MEITVHTPPFGDPSPRFAKPQLRRHSTSTVPRGGPAAEIVSRVTIGARRRLCDLRDLGRGP